MRLAPLPDGKKGYQKEEQTDESDYRARQFGTVCGLALLLNLALLPLRLKAGCIKVGLALQKVCVKLFLELVVALQIAVGVGKPFLRLGCLGTLLQNLCVIFIQRVVPQPLFHLVVNGQHTSIFPDFP